MTADGPTQFPSGIYLGSRYSYSSSSVNEGGKGRISRRVEKSDDRIGRFDPIYSRDLYTCVYIYKLKRSWLVETNYRRKRVRRMVRSPMDANSDGFDAEFEIALDTSQLSSVRSQLLGECGDGGRRTFVTRRPIVRRRCVFSNFKDVRFVIREDRFSIISKSVKIFTKTLSLSLSLVSSKNNKNIRIFEKEKESFRSRRERRRRRFGSVSHAREKRNEKDTILQLSRKNRDKKSTSS